MAEYASFTDPKPGRPLRVEGQALLGEDGACFPIVAGVPTIADAMTTQFRSVHPNRADHREQPVPRRAHRLIVGGLAHETNSFSPVPTTLAAFRQRSYLTGEAIIRQSRTGRSVFTGIVEYPLNKIID